MGLLKSLRRNKKTVYCGYAVVYNDSKDGQGEDKVAIWFPENGKRLMSIDDKMKDLKITDDRVKSYAEIAYDQTAKKWFDRFSIIGYRTYRDLRQFDMDGLIDLKATRALRMRMKAQDGRLILENAFVMRNLPTDEKQALNFHPMKTAARALKDFFTKPY